MRNLDKVEVEFIRLLVTVFKVISLSFLVSQTVFGSEVQNSPATGGIGESWPGEEKNWVIQVLKANSDLARQFLSQQTTVADRQAARQSQLPIWFLTGEAVGYPQARAPLALGATTILPGQDRFNNQASVQVNQALPTGGTVTAEAGTEYRRPNGGAWQDTQAITLSLKQPLLKGFGANSETRYGFALAQVNESIAQATLRAKILDVVGDARTKYWNVLLKVSQLHAYEADSAYWEQSLRTADARHRLGDMAEDEYLRYRIQALGARQSLLEGRFNYRQSVAELMILVGNQGNVKAEMAYRNTEKDRSDSLLKSLGLGFKDDFESLPLSPMNAQEHMLAHHPTVIRLAQLKKRAEMEVSRAHNSQLPQLDIDASWRKPMGGKSDSRVAAQFTWTLPTITANRDMVKALIQVKTEKLDSAQTLLIMQTGLARLSDQVELQRQRLALAQEKLTLERSRSRIAERRHAMGDLDFTEMQLSASDRLQAEQDVAIAYVGLRLLIAEMESWSGIAMDAIGVEVGEIKP
jgi:outer membrane protein TolC